MALYAQGTVTGLALVNLLVKVVLVSIVRIRLMALQAQFITFLEQRQAVNVMAVTAANVILLHLALYERAPDIDLLENLTVDVVHALLQQRRHLILQQIDLAVVVVANLAAA